MFNEISALRNLWEACRSRVSSAIDSLASNPLGVFAQLREFNVPVRNSRYEETRFNTVIVDESYGLYGYKQLIGLSNFEMIGLLFREEVSTQITFL